TKPLHRIKPIHQTFKLSFTLYDAGSMKVKKSSQGVPRDRSSILTVAITIARYSQKTGANAVNSTHSNTIRNFVCYLRDTPRPTDHWVVQERIQGDVGYYRRRDFR